MTVAALNPSRIYLENGVTLDFPVPFRFLKTALVVRRRLASGAISTLLEGADYSVSGGETDAGGTVTLAASVSGAKLVISRRTSRAQAMDYTPNDRFPADSHEAVADRSMMIDQEQDALADRAILVQDDEAGFLLPSVAARQGKFFAFDAAGMPAPASGTGNDAALRTDLAAETGAELVGVRRAGIGSPFVTVADKVGYLLDASEFLVDDNFASDQTDAVDAWLTECAERNYTPDVRNPMRAKISSAVVYDPTAGVIPAMINMANLMLLATFNGGISFGSVGGNFAATQLVVPRVVRSGATTWGVDSDASMLSNEVGVILYNFNKSKILLGDVRGFTIGVAYHSENFPFANNQIYGGVLEDSRYNEVLRTVRGLINPGPDADFINENNWFGGARRENGSSDGLGNAYGTVFVAGANAYRGHNNNHWWGTSYEMGAPASGATRRVPVFLNKAGGFNKWHDPRHETGIGPFGIALNGGGTGGQNAGCFNEVEFGYQSGANSGWRSDWLQVGGAFGNLSRSIETGEHRWHSGPLDNILSSGGPAANARIQAPLFLKRAPNANALRQSTVASDIITNTKGVQLGSGIGLFVELDTTRMKNLRIAECGPVGFGGRLTIQAYDSSGALLTGNATDATWGDEPYVKFSPSQVNTGSFGGAYTNAADNGDSDRIITIREEVKKIHIGYAGASFALAISSFDITGYPTLTSQTSNSVFNMVTLGLSCPTADAIAQRLASAKPDTAGVHGKYAKGEIILNTTVTSGQAMGWQCSTAGYLAAAWTSSTAFSVPGQCATNDSGKVYSLKTPGTSASSGGPTGTGASIADSGCTWEYIGVLATFVALANLP